MIYFRYLKGNVFIANCQEAVWPKRFPSRQDGFPALLINSFSL